MNNDLILRIYKRVVILSLLIIGVSAFVFKDPKPIILGYVFGAIISMLGLKLLDNTINKAVKMPPEKATSYTITHYFLRYFIYFTVLLVAAIADYLNILAAALGLIIVKLVIIISAVFNEDFVK